MAKKRFASEDFVNGAVSDALSKAGGTSLEIPVGEKLHLDGEGYDGDKMMCILQKGTYWIDDHTELSIEEIGLCILSRQVDYYFMTFICESGIKFFDYIDATGSNELSTDEPNRELRFENVDSLLSFSAIEDYSTTFSCIHLMSPSGNAYMVSVDDDGNLTATPHD